jgi:diguanylate cyclase (GGDEF)-like protein
VELDFLTGVRQPARAGPQAGRLCRRAPSAPGIELLLLDLDHFKRSTTNTAMRRRQGAGASVDRAASAHASSDRIFRYGGEEFAIIASGAEADAALRLAENLRVAVSLAQLLEQRPVTISIGVAMMDKRTSPREWLLQADQMLYRAKEEGRNTVRVAPYREA